MNAFTKVIAGAAIVTASFAGVIPAHASYISNFTLSAVGNSYGFSGPGNSQSLSAATSVNLGTEMMLSGIGDTYLSGSSLVFNPSAAVTFSGGIVTSFQSSITWTGATGTFTFTPLTVTYATSTANGGSNESLSLFFSGNVVGSSSSDPVQSAFLTEAFTQSRGSQGSVLSLSGTFITPNAPTPTPAPEPAAMLMLGSGLLGLAAVRRRRG